MRFPPALLGRQNNIDHPPAPHYVSSYGSSPGYNIGLNGAQASRLQGHPLPPIALPQYSNQGPYIYHAPGPPFPATKSPPASAAVPDNTIRAPLMRYANPLGYPPLPPNASPADWRTGFQTALSHYNGSGGEPAQR
jgi:hypothetical protein